MSDTFTLEMIYALIGAVLYSGAIVINRLKSGETFKLEKIVRTLIVTLIVGFTIGKAGFTEITADTWQNAISTNTGVIAVVDQIVSFVWKFFKKD